MPRGTLTFRQRDITAAIRGVEASGRLAMRVEIDRDGKIVVHTDRSEFERAARTVPNEGQGRNEWDDA